MRQEDAAVDTRDIAEAVDPKNVLSSFKSVVPDDVIPNQWYGILLSSSVKKRSVAVTRFGEKLLLYRKSDGGVICMINRCPHRGMELTEGRIFGDEIECPFHAFRFAPSGNCTLMPCEGKDAKIPMSMKATTLPAREKHGIIWVWWGASAEDLDRASLPDVPWHENLPDTPYASSGEFLWPVPHHRAIENAIDAHHAPALHGQRRGTKGWKVKDLGRRTFNKDFSVASVAGGIDSHYTFYDENDPLCKPFFVEVDYREPGIIYARINKGLYILTIDSPVDHQNTWRIIRYYNVKVKVPIVGSLVAWLMRQIDQSAIQWSEDYWIIKGQQAPIPGVLDDHYIRSDKVVGLYYALQKKLMRENMIYRDVIPAIVRRHCKFD